MASVGLQGVCKDYVLGRAAHRAIDHLDLEILDGELLALVGPSGCGKTTTLRLIAGLEAPTIGSIHFDGIDVKGTAPHERGTAFVFQHGALYPHLTVLGNLSFPLRARRVPKGEARRLALDTAERLGIDGLLQRRPHQLSGGERQRVALARALVRTPRVLLLDEPLSHLDAHLRGQLRGEIQRIHAQWGVTTMYVTHDQEEAMTLGGRLAVIDHGRIQQIGPPAEVHRRPANRFVAGFIGRPSMNFLHGRWVQRGGSCSFEGGFGRLTSGTVPEIECCSNLDQDFILGVRPEHVHLDGKVNKRSTSNGLGLEMVIERIEYLGDRRHVYLRGVGNTELVASVGPSDPPAITGSSVSAHWHLRDVHFFAPDGKRQRISGLFKNEDDKK